MGRVGEVANMVNSFLYGAANIIYFTIFAVRVLTLFSFSKGSVGEVAAHHSPSRVNGSLQVPGSTARATGCFALLCFRIYMMFSLHFQTNIM